MTRTGSTERILLRHRDAAWLPGGDADVVLAGPGSVPPSPTCVVRLLVTRGRWALTVQRDDGSGLDIPSLSVSDGEVDRTLRELMIRWLGTTQPARLLGYVRNVVEGAPDGYPWPLPHAHFAVWHCALPADRDLGGTWLDACRAEAHLGHRHWWPLTEHIPWGQG